VLHALYARDATHLCRWLGIRPRNAVTVLDTHDGIGVQDVDADSRRPGPGLLPPQDIHALVATIHERSRGDSRHASGTAAANVDVHQINCTFYDALGRRDDEYLVARAIQCFVPGIPQIYYVGLLAGGNDMELLRRTGVGRDINRHYYVDDEVARAMERPVVQALCDLLRFRSRHPSFDGTSHVSSPAPDQLVLEWRNESDWARLDVDLGRMHASIVGTRVGEPSATLVWTT
jgi:sucrose phosphorylase